MDKLTIEMSKVSACSVSECSFNRDNNCHAKAITIGDATFPGCDTFLNSSEHTQETVRIAGVGACKVRQCRYNEDLECSASHIAVGHKDNRAFCLTFANR